MVPEYHLFSCKIIADNGILERILRLRQVRELSDKISRYLSGEFEYEGGSLIFSCSKIEINMKPGEIYTGSFTIEEQSGKDVEGKVYSTNMIVQCLTQQISGAQIIRIFLFSFCHVFSPFFLMRTKSVPSLTPISGESFASTRQHFF